MSPSGTARPRRRNKSFHGESTEIDGARTATPSHHVTPQSRREEIVQQSKLRKQQDLLLKNAHQGISRGILFLALLAFRIANALLLRTFFQPDEFYQALEPAWQLAFGPGSGAWITWEWQAHLRSSAHPMLFGAVYRVAAIAGDFLGLYGQSYEQLLLAAPKALQGCIAACIDFFIWKIGHRLDGSSSRLAHISLLLSVLSPWQWFCSGRTFSNSLETALTASALSLWPYGWMVNAEQGTKKVTLPGSKNQYETHDIAIALLLAAFATILRPTGAVLWMVMALITLINSTTSRRWLLIQLAPICGAVALLFNLYIDKLYYGTWTLPAWQFFEVNARDRIADFYGVNRLDYYFTEGMPLLLCVLPVAIMLWRLIMALISPASAGRHNMSRLKAAAFQAYLVSILVVLIAFSAIAHKEARFIYPLLPMFTPLAADALQRFDIWTTKKYLWRVVFVVTILCQVVLAWYVSQVHQTGVIDVMHYLRHQRGLHKEQGIPANMSVGFLMPCHSTPWRSHLIHADIHAWALTCEPPLNVPFQQRSSYRDEADQFYDNPEQWLNAKMDARTAVDTSVGSRHWSDYLVFFKQLEPLMREHAATRGYIECWRGFNSHWHDDWRRNGDVIVYRRRSQV